MAELVFIAATIFVAYTLLTVLGVNEDLPAQKEEATPEGNTEIKAVAETQSESKPAASVIAASPRKRAAPVQSKSADNVPDQSKPAANVVAKPKAAAKPKASEKTKVAAEKKPTNRTRTAKAAAEVAPAPQLATANVPGDSLKNPKTGEVVKIPNSYAFAKRWIKDALVEEKLLDKIYKNAELDNATNARIQEALEKLKQLPKYQ